MCPRQMMTTVLVRNGVANISIDFDGVVVAVCIDRAEGAVDEIEHLHPQHLRNLVIDPYVLDVLVGKVLDLLGIWRGASFA